ncbi:hypothetical protein JDV02_002548 [Purpureocillium takamizusanense]|uniref:Uncharacterized protein n=1 Tax=Purpureocillium takamizusanense TaxID=2060973 RepID=A0A9Q8Q8X0_9HYPO|nr:uncharacterized protein JDV02_002548 [Purpureocillium takamizusanense]UNI16074.1 hypothetical protein JDV02_002548 [Purpureocillium takamizusanense]
MGSCGDAKEEEEEEEEDDDDEHDSPRRLRAAAVARVAAAARRLRPAGTGQDRTGQGKGGQRSHGTARHSRSGLAAVVARCWDDGAPCEPRSAAFLSRDPGMSGGLRMQC